jgi:hypothetical protein
MSAERAPFASVIVAVNPHEYDFSVVLDGWATQAGAAAFEVVVAHDGRRRELDAEIEAHRSRHPRTPVRCVRAGGIGRGALNNAGVSASRGDLLVFSADDSRAPPGYVAAHRAFHDALERPGVGVGPIWFLRALRDDPFRRWLEDSGENYGFPLSQGAIAWQPGFFFVGNASLRRETYDAVGGFDERFPYDMHEDHLFGQALLAAGYRFTPLPRAYALHDHPVDFEERKEAMRRLGATSALLGDAHAHLARARATGAGDLAALRRREREAEAAASGTRSVAAWRRRWIAGLDVAYAEGALGAAPGSGIRPRRSEG